MDDLVVWLRAQLDEDERIARAAVDVVGLVPGARNWRLDESPSDEGGRYWRITTLAPDDTVPTVELVGSGMQGGGVHEEAVGRHIVEHGPSRVLREIEAKRNVLRMAAEATEQAGSPDYLVSGPAKMMLVALRPVLLHFAAVYAARPGYRKEWRL